MELPEIIGTKFTDLAKHWDECRPLLVKRKVPAHTRLLLEGETSKKIYIVVRGALRLWHNETGQDITVQFFFENEIVSSFESFYLQKPSDCSLETIEESEILELSQENFKKLSIRYPDLERSMMRWICERFIAYRKRVISQLQNTPMERYQELLTNEPELTERVPLHMIASYIGVTPVSLSRIRKRL